MSLKRNFLAGAALLALAGTLSTVRSADPDRSSDDETELGRLEKTWNDAHLQNDADTLDHLWDDEIAVIVPKMKVINKAEALAVLRSGRVKFLRYETKDLSARIFHDTAIVTGHLIRTRKFNEREVSDEWRFTKVYVRRFNEWRVVLWQTSDWSGG
jgi:ketosteroid isomerase-like protein